MELRTIYDTLDFYNHRWTVEILASLASGPKRFNALLRDTGNVNAKPQWAALQRLEEKGLVLHPNDVDGEHYALTPYGEWALAAIQAFVEQVSRWENSLGDGDRSSRS